jgi:predicted nucleic acid-binding protein
MKIVVIDTSALIRLYVPDGPVPRNLEKYVTSAWRSETILMVPELALAEVAQVLWKKEAAGYLHQSHVDEIISAVLELPIEIIGHYDLLHDALLLARNHSLTVYDSLFLALAVKKKAELVTSDRRLKEAFESNSDLS